jgi:membrane protease subunit HflK
MYLDTMQEILSSTSKVMIDTKAATTVNLPLDQMLSRSVANEAAIGSRSGPVMPAPQGQPALPNVGTVTVTGTAPQPQAMQQPQPQQPTQQQAQQQQQQPQAAPAQAARPQEPVRKADPRSRDSSRERETR